MTYLIHLKDARVLIKDAASGCLLADTTIKHYDPHSNKIKIPMSSIAFRENILVTLWIFTGDDIYEYSGRVRRTVVANEVEIALFAGHNKNHRRYKRCRINAQGLIEGIILGNQAVIFHKPIHITAMNISRSGLRIRAMSGSLEAGDVFLVSLDVPGRQFRYVYQVVNVQNSTLETEEYGCKIFQSK